MKYSKDYPEYLVNWDLFVLRHQNKTNVFIHLISFLFFWVSPILAIYISPWFIIGFFISGLIGTLGHYLLKDGTVDAKEATSSLQVVHFSSKMAFMFLTGKYFNEIEFVNKKYHRYLNGEISSKADSEMFSKLGNK